MKAKNGVSARLKQKLKEREEAAAASTKPKAPASTKPQDSLGLLHNYNQVRCGSIVERLLETDATKDYEELCAECGSVV